MMISSSCCITKKVQAHCDDHSVNKKKVIKNHNINTTIAESKQNIYVTKQNFHFVQAPYIKEQELKMGDKEQNDDI